MNASHGCLIRRHRSVKGFSLVELMVVVTIVAILTAVAYPAYTHYVVRTRRTAATACMSQYANFMERYYTTNMAYNKDGTTGAVYLGPTSLDCAGTPQTGNFYKYDLALAPATYVITATPKNQQLAADTQCGTLTLDNTGKRTANGSTTTTGCW